jgi:hypothetical protein
MDMKIVTLLGVCMMALVLVGGPVAAAGPPYATTPCVPDRPVPPETIGGISFPFDIPIWPTIVKTEFHILPWISFGKANICLPGCSKPIQIPAPCFSLQPIPVWFPWLRPLDVECQSEPCRLP